MAWKAKTVVALPVLEDREVHPGIVVQVASGETIRKEPGDKISKKDMDEAGQTAEDIERLIADDAIEEE